MKKVCICAHFGGGKELLNGQTVKAHVISREIEKQLGENQVVRIDSHGSYSAVLKLTLQLIRALYSCMNIIIMPGENGLKFFIPSICFFNVFFRRKIHYVVVGGWLHGYLEKHIFIRNLLHKCDYIYVQTEKMKNDLEGAGYRNIINLPNCKDLDILSEDELVYNMSAPYKLCTFSRVAKEKGIEDAVEAVIKINEKSSETVYLLDIYGQIDTDYEARFLELSASFPEYIRYCGSVPFDHTTEVIKDYFALLFPTYYDGEGFAGCLIDAYSSGVPVIASDWKYNREFVDDEVGYIFKVREVEALSETLEKLKNNISEVNSKKISCIKRAYCYTTEFVLEMLISRLDR